MPDAPMPDPVLPDAAPESVPKAGREATVLPVVEERLRVAVHPVVTGRVRVRVETQVEEAVVAERLTGETVEVTRVAMDREVSERPELRIEGDVTIIPVVEEVLVVERRLVLREEVHLRRIVTTDEIATTVPLRRQRVVVERDGERDGAGLGRWRQIPPTFTELHRTRPSPNPNFTNKDMNDERL